MTLYSPNVEVVEIDLSESISNNFVNVVAVFAGNFEKGPMNAFVYLDTVEDLITIYGRPTDKNYNDWYQIYNFLQYNSGKIAISRVGGIDTYVPPPIYSTSSTTDNVSYAFSVGDSTISTFVPNIEESEDTENISYNFSVGNVTITTQFSNCVIASYTTQIYPIVLDTDSLESSFTIGNAELKTILSTTNNETESLESSFTIGDATLTDILKDTEFSEELESSFTIGNAELNTILITTNNGTESIESSFTMGNAELNTILITTNNGTESIESSFTMGNATLDTQ